MTYRETWFWLAMMVAGLTLAVCGCKRPAPRAPVAQYELADCAKPVEQMADAEIEACYGEVY